MTVRKNIVRVFQDGKPRLVRELLELMPDGVNRPAVSKECQYLAALGLLTATRVVNWHHGKCYRFTPNDRLLAPWMAFHKEAVVETIMNAPRPVSNRDIRLVLAVVCSEKVTRRMVQAELDVLEARGSIVLSGQSTRYPRYTMPSREVAAWRRLGDALCAAARGAPQQRRGPRHRTRRG